MNRRFYQCGAALLAAWLFVMALVGGASAEALASNNLYGPGSFSVSTQCPSLQAIVDLPIDHSWLESITVNGSVSGSTHLKDKNGNIDKVVSGSYSFTTVNSDELDACVIGGGKVNLTFQGQLNWYSGIWAGYGVNGFNADPNTYNSIVGSWTVPSASCSILEDSQSATWIGFGGIPNTGAAQMIEQMGTRQGCATSGTALYDAVYENYSQNNPTELPTRITQGCDDTNHHSCTVVPANVNAGDSMTVKISYIGNGVFQMEEYDFTQHWWIVFGTSQSDSSNESIRFTAEWIEEAPPPNSFTNFGQVNFYGCSVDGKSIRDGGPAIQQITMKHNGGAIMAQPLGLTGHGDSFSVLFENK